MPLTHYACSNCGHWQIWFDHQTPISCPICADTRNALPPDGWDFRNEVDAQGMFTNHWAEVEPGLWGFWATPKFGLGATGWLLQRDDGNVAFEGCPYYQPDALAKIRELGGIRVLAASHPHGYGALWQLQREFDPVLTIHRGDIPYSKAFHVNCPADDLHEIAPGLTLHHVGGHYEGHAVMYDATRRVLFCGDSLKIEFDTDGHTPIAISSHKAFHYKIPLTRDELAKYARVFAALPFQTALTPFEYAPGVTRELALALFAQLIAGQPHTAPVLLADLQRRMGN